LVIRAINAYLKWAASAERIAYLKEERVLSIFALPQVALLTKWKPKGFCPRRLHAIVLPLLDTGCRIDEVLSLRLEDCDTDSLLFTVTAKGKSSGVSRSPPSCGES
jgi:integrase/recombinase XerD